MLDHDINTGTTAQKWYVSKKDGMMYSIKNGKVNFQIPIATGVNKDTDGWTRLGRVNGKAVYDRSLTTSSTPAGVFTLDQKMKLYNEPAYRLITAGNNEKMSAVVHGPATKQREA